jgi:pimeloyl-ACP methyl ester carboxylesterase
MTGRCNSRSKGDRTTDMTVGQQARDAPAIINAMSSDKAIIFWSSRGGITGLELAAVKPEVIDFLIVHEPPVIEQLPDTDAKRWRSFHHDIYMKSRWEGWQAALPDFMASHVGAPIFCSHVISMIGFQSEMRDKSFDSLDRLNSLF